MINETNFITRLSGRKENHYYIDYLGKYTTNDIARIIGLSPIDVKLKYSENGGVFDQEFEVYYFPNIEGANKTIVSLIKDITSEKKGKPIYLSESEIEFIRKALINEGSNTIHVSSKVKDSIFKKLNQ